LLTQVVVDRRDAAFQRPTKPIGALYDETAARQLAASRGWLLDRDGPGWRRVIASPEPLRILEEATIARLVAAGVVVVCSGGGGIPVLVDSVGAVRGVEAVIDKDLSAALLAAHLHADGLILLTDADAVYTDWGTSAARSLSRAGVAALRSLPLPAGTMGPKVEAACRFTEATGYPSFIGALVDAAAVLEGHAGTTVSSASTGLTYST
jgi:carbamate kinase